MDIFIPMVMAFIIGMLFDHFVLNKLAGMVSAEVAKLQADFAALGAKVTPPAAPPAPVVPVTPQAPTVTKTGS